MSAANGTPGAAVTSTRGETDTTPASADHAAKRIAAVGAGRMGRGIAIAFAYAGLAVDLIDLKPRTDEAWAALAEAARAEVHATLAMLAALGAVPPALVDTIAARVRLVRNEQAYAALAQADVVFEGVPETLAAKREACARICAAARADATLASTTSTILVTDLVPLVTRPERLINAHWLNPAYLVPLVELSPHPGTSPSITAGLAALLEHIGKVTVQCAAAPGYIVPRLQALIMNEAARMVEEGVATAADIDKATRCGLGLRFAAIGVVEFIDFGGVDILHHASRYLAENLSPTRYTAPDVIARMMAAGETGLKGGTGFYDYRGIDVAAYRQNVLQRMLGMVKHTGHYRPPAT